MLQSVTYASTGLSISHWLHLAGQGRFYFLPHIRNPTQVYPSFYPFNCWRYFCFAQATLVKVKDYLHLILKVIKRGALPTYPPALFFYSDIHRHEYVPGHSSDPPRLREYRGVWRRQGRYAKSKLHKAASFIEVQPLNVYHNTHTYILFVALIFPK